MACGKKAKIITIASVISISVAFVIIFSAVVITRPAPKSHVICLDNFHQLFNYTRDVENPYEEIKLAQYRSHPVKYIEKKCLNYIFSYLSRKRAKPASSLVIQLLVYSSQHPVQTVNNTEEWNLIDNTFSPDRPVFVICHGYSERANKPWILRLMSGFKKAFNNADVVLVDWGATHNFYLLDYGQQAGNVETVGQVVGNFLAQEHFKGQIQLDKVHLVGFSLGAHAMGYAGKEVSRLTDGGILRRISGLDPAGPTFKNVDPWKRLSKDDAEFVDVIHTDMKILGLEEAIGHVDFYPNGGYLQIHEYGKPSDHHLSHEMFIASLDSDDEAKCFSYTCPKSLEEFEKKFDEKFIIMTEPLPKSRLGLYSEEYGPQQDRQCLKTSDGWPYCIE